MPASIKGCVARPVAWRWRSGHEAGGVSGLRSEMSFRVDNWKLDHKLRAFQHDVVIPIRPLYFAHTVITLRNKWTF